MLKMLKRKQKEFVGPRQKSRRALKASQDFANTINGDVANNNSSQNAIVRHISDKQIVIKNVTLIADKKNEHTLSKVSTSSCSDTSLLNSSLSISSKNSSPEEKSVLREQLVQWATLKHKISHSALTDLLHILSPYHPELPLSSRTLLATPNFTDMNKLETGDLCYFGIENALKKIVLHSPIDRQLQICFNVDGIPLFRSSKLQLWPILGLIKNIPNSIVFTVAVFCGKSKPKPLNLFVKSFIDELNSLLQNGLVIGNDHINVSLHSFICDAPARAYLKCTKSHTGYSSCDKCTVHGDYYMNKVVFDSIESQKRSDESFRMQLDEDHHIAETPLTQLPINLIKCFPTDYMHNVCLGIVKKLLHTWIGGSLKVRLSSHEVKVISQRLLDLKKYIPMEFNRKPRTLDELSYWKATEFRQFLLYLGPLVLTDILDIAIYENFLAFHFSIYILLSKKHIKKFGVSFVRNVINIFINHLKTLYGLEFMIYNVHLLSHICDDVESFGVLDNFSAFPFENYLGQLKSLIKSPINPIQQIHRRLVERDLIISKGNSQYDHLKLVQEHTRGPLPNFNSGIKYHQQFSKIIFHDTTFSVLHHSKADCYCLTKNGNKIVEIHNILKADDNNIYVVGKEFISYSDLYSYPYPSSHLTIFVVNNLSDFKIWSINDIFGKCFVLPFRQKGCVAIPIIHSIMG
ncbi:uncharacterized protein LOC126739865 isoform X1 [Anthonomus grandis grandis]|uniref:uncharacterized protein LOC126739865 isoform X1 n=1 Tax=Anthonomus grandis grandis TaxID=2921223 RepID=UPI00216696AE|nr:uncharacterized protein LOC126739865 isoform X1 [Anthonomus grandis grandis]XP_050301639.1 uncharacterized protein LOC126739865 isoform X1 [Anthonomus grandis grandis]XP_050301640.1 uncharacterized protein LOC126739865 isoform X1 [Anthonomus grandis grandis]